MKSKLPYLFVLITAQALSIQVFSQNVVKNGGFEQYQSAPTNEGQIGRTKWWDEVVASADYMNTTYAGWTSHNGGAHAGNGYAGFALYGNAIGACEAIGQTMAPGAIGVDQQYLIRLFAKKATNTTGTGYADICGGIEVYGFAKQPKLGVYNDHPSNLPNAKLLWSSRAISDTVWKQEVGCFIPTSNVTYIVVCLTKVVGCQQYVYIDDFVIEPFKPDLGPDTTLCEGDFLRLNVQKDSATYLWQDGSVNSYFDVNSPGIYTVEVSVSSCKASDTMVAATKPIPSFYLGKDTALCEGDSIKFTVNYPMGTHLWQNGETTNSIVVKNTTQVILVIDLDGCKRSDTIQVDVKKSISVNLGPDVSVCASKMIQLKAFVSGATYLWRSGEVSDKITASNEGLYFVVVSKKPCYARDSIYITHRDLPRLQLSENAIVCDGDSMHFLAQSSSDSTQLTWFNGTTSPNFVAYEPGFYWVEAKNGCGAIRDSVQLIWQACFCNLHVPNAFTPDDWGANNRFGPVHSCLLIEYEFVVYNRWGQMIFQTNDPQARWNGFYGNKQSPAGVYMYTCRYQLMRGEKVNLKGVVHLLR